MARKIRKQYIFVISVFFCCLISSTFSFSQSVPTPDVKCISVLANGDVILTWATPASGAFVSYHIDTSSFAAGPFATYTTVTTYTTTTCIHAGAGANTKRMYYQVLSESSIAPIISTPKGVFSTIFLSVTNPGNGTAVLNWNAVSTPAIPTSTGWYKVYRDYPAGIWGQRDSTQSLAFADVIDICSTVLNYRIGIEDNTGCTSFSNVAGGSLFTDITPPALPSLDTVSVDAATDQAMISWNLSPSLDATGYVIYQKQGIPWNPIDTVPAPATFYQNLLSNAGNMSELYRIAVLDSCGNISPLGTFHNTIYLSVSFDICATTSDLIWNKYVNWTPGVSQYEIWKSVNSGPFTMIGTNTNADTSYLDTGLVLGTPYCYFIRATNGTKTSSSNRVCFSPNVTQPPAFTYNRFATVLNDKSIRIKAHIDISATSVKYYRIQRATGSGSFSVIMPAILPTGNTINFVDNTVNTTTNSYIYKLDAMDSCAHVITSSNPDTTILLNANIEANLDIALSWNDYGSFDGKTGHYKIYRAIDGVWDPAPIGTYTYTGNGGTFTDDVAPYLSSKGIFSYYVTAVENTVNTYGFSDSSNSNVVKVDLYPKYYIPNTFTPNGDNLNDLFLPIIGFIEQTNYSLMIFDNTGTPVFESLSPSEGWDGTKKGHRCQAGVYMYLIKCRATNGDDSKISGTISLYR